MSAPYPKLGGHACEGADTNLWFPTAATSADARKICQSCKVQQQCLDYALSVDTDGIWGGLSREERRTIQRKQAA